MVDPDFDLDNSLSQSYGSEVNDSDHDEVHKAYRHRGKVLRRWLRLVKVNSTLFFLTSIAWIVYTFFLSSTKLTHNIAICILGIVCSIVGLLTSLGSKDPSPLKIYFGAIANGLGCAVISLYVILGLSLIVLQSIDQQYEDQFDNFTLNEVGG